MSQYSQFLKYLQDSTNDMESKHQHSTEPKLAVAYFYHTWDVSARYFARVQQECKDQFPDSVMFFSIAIDEPGSISYSELLQEPDTAPLKLDRLPATCYFLNKHPIVVARPGWQDDVKLVGSITKQAFMDSVTTARLLLTQKRHVEHICIDE